MHDGNGVQGIVKFAVGLKSDKRLKEPLPSVKPGLSVVVVVLLVIVFPVPVLVKVPELLKIRLFCKNPLFPALPGEANILTISAQSAPLVHVLL